MAAGNPYGGAAVLCASSLKPSGNPPVEHVLGVAVLPFRTGSDVWCKDAGRTQTISRTHRRRSKVSLLFWTGTLSVTRTPTARRACSILGSAIGGRDHPVYR